MTGPTNTADRIAALTASQRAALEERLRQLAVGEPSQDRIPRRDGSAPAPLGVAQQREWTISRLRGANNVPSAFRIEGDIDIDRLGQALTRLLERHEILRTTFRIGPSGVPEQSVLPVTAVPTPIVDLSALGAARQREEIRAVCRAELGRPFASDATQRLRITLIRVAPTTHVCLLISDHACSDAWSLAIIMRELAALYAEQHGGPALSPVELQFADYAAWQRDQIDETSQELELAHWIETLKGIEAVTGLPTDFALPSRPTYEGDTCAVRVPPADLAGIRVLADRDHTSLFTVLLAVAAVVVSRHRSSADVLIGSLVSGRTRVETEDLVGCFANPLPLRVHIRGEQTVHDLLREARETLAVALDHQNLPFEQLVSELGLDRSSAQTSLSRLWINVITVPLAELEVPGLRFASAAIDLGLASVDLTLSAVPDEYGLRLEWQYMTELFERPTVELFATQYLRVLHQVVTDPDLPLDEIELAAPEGDGPAAPPNGSVVEGIRARASLAPYAVAVAADGVSLCYRELCDAAARIQAQLSTMRTPVGGPVGVLLDGVALAVGLLAASASAASESGQPAEWLLLDPADPLPENIDRLAAVGAQAVLAQGQSTHESSRGVHVIGLHDSSGQLPPAHAMDHVPLLSLAKPSEIRRIGRSLSLGAGDRLWYGAPPGPRFPTTAVLATWLVGGTVVVGAPSSGLLTTASAEGITILVVGAVGWRRLLTEATSVAIPASLRLIVVDEIAPEELTEVREHLPVSVMICPW